MRVLLWSASFWPCLGGLEVISAEFLSAAKDRGVDFLVITTVPGPDSWQGIPVHRFRLSDLSLESDFLRVVNIRTRIRKLFQEFKPDLVHVNGIGGNIPMLLLCLPTGLPYLVTLHGSWLDWRPTLMGQLFTGADWLAACSQDTLDTLHKFEPGLAENSSLICNALPERAAPGIHRGDHLLCAGRLSIEKGFDIALRAMAKLPRGRLRIAGEGRELSALQALSQELGIESRVEFLGALERCRLAEEMAAAQALLCPSRLEGFGLVALEAAQAGTPTLAARVGGLPEVVVDGETGVLVDSHDPALWARAIEYFLASDQGEVMGQRARVRAAQVFRWDDYVESYMKLYGKLLNRSPQKESVHRDRILRARHQMLAREGLPWQASFQVAGGTVHLRTDHEDLLQTWSKVWSPSSTRCETDMVMDVSLAEGPRAGYVWAGDLTAYWQPWGCLNPPNGPVLAYQRPGIEAYYHRASRHLVGRVDRVDQLLPCDLGKPFLLPVLTWLTDRDVRVYHAAVVAWEGRGVLLVGVENSGKSTVLLSCLLAGWEFVADDLVVIQDGQVAPVYACTWMAPDHARHQFPSLWPRLRQHPLDPKGLLWIDDIPAARRARARVVAAILVAPTDHHHTTLTVCSRGTLLRALIPGSFSLIPGIQDGRKLQEICRLLSLASSWRLELGRDRSNIPALLAGLL